MNSTLIMIIVIITAFAIAAFFAVRYFRKKNVEKLFEQIYDTSKQIPKQKKKNFILLMFTESMSRPIKKSKSAAHMNRLNNPKYIEIQMIQMGKILKDTSKVEDKATKRALKLLTEYLAWEEDKITKAKALKEEKTA